MRARECQQQQNRLHKSIRPIHEGGQPGKHGRCHLDQSLQVRLSNRRPARPAIALNAPAEELRRILDWQRGCLAGEVRALQPTSVVFFTGRAYDRVLVDEFPGTTFETIGDRDPQQFARVVHSSLPRPSFRTYHPSYLTRSGKWLWVE
jgi:hypothetical protein